MEHQKQIAVVTGASSGLGRCFVKELEKSGEIEEIWVIARRKKRLRELEMESSLPIRVLSVDLTDPAGFSFLRRQLSGERPDLRILINCAGFGKIGSYRDISEQDCMDMIDLNCRAAVMMTRLCLPWMESGAQILEICSTSAFQPFPYLNIYAASKAFLLRYSRALRWELKGRGIHVTAVCPYWIKDTEFIPGAKETRNGQAIRHFPLASKSERVVNRALRDNRAGLAVSTPGPICFLHRIAAKFIPHSIMMALWEGIRKI